VHIAYMGSEPLDPRKLLVKGVVRWASARVTRIISGLFAWKTASYGEPSPPDVPKDTLDAEPYSPCIFIGTG
jgi:hypothetical protein